MALPMQVFSAEEDHVWRCQAWMLPRYLASFNRLIEDPGGRGLRWCATAKEIISAGSLGCQRIVASSAVPSISKEGGHHASRAATEESRKCSQAVAAFFVGRRNPHPRSHVWEQESTAPQHVTTHYDTHRL